MNLCKAIQVAMWGAAAILPAAGAWALTPTQVGQLTPGNILYVSGSTATDNAIKAYFKLDSGVDSTAPCVNGTYDLYTTASGYVITCQASATFGSGIGNFAIVKQTKGGSATGIHNVAEQIPTPTLSFPDLSNPSNFTATCNTGTTTAAASPFMQYNTYACTLAESQTIQPNAGISDEDPNTWIGTGGVTNSDAAALTVKNGLEVPFGIIVSTALRNRLQVAEGLTTGSAEALSNVPSLTIAQLRAILSGQMTSLFDLYVYPSSNVATQVDPGSNTLHICRRGNTSGSEFAANIYFFGSGCSKGSGVGTVASPDVGSTATAGATWAAADSGEFVFAGAGTGDVLNCVGSAQDSGDPSGNYRIGFVSMDQVPTVSGSWRYIAINGIAPTIWNIQQGNYDWLTEDTFNSTPTSLALNYSSGTNNHSAIFSALQSHIGNLSSLAGLNAASQNAAALADTSSGGADTGLVTLGNSVLFGTSDPSGPSAPTWPKAIRSIAVAGQGPNSPLSKTYPSEAVNNCNGAYQSDPTG